jgi:uncharacterized protein YcnI
MYRKISSVLVTLSIFTIPSLASAHVAVTPTQVGIGQELVFSISSPNEHKSAITSIKIDIPKGVSAVIPTTKAGWTVTATTEGAGDAAAITAITWTDGEIPAGQRTDFSFGAQVPASVTSLDWKAYQTYADGSIVHWDQIPSGSDDSTGTAGPYSVTKVVNDLTPKVAAVSDPSSNFLPIALGAAALALSLVGIISRKKV